MAADPGIAIVGIGCRFPGAVSPAGFWELLLAGRTGIREVPDERTALRAAGGYGGFVDGLDRFDPDFFGISVAEAAAMDPQQRLVLEVAWEALEDGGLVPAQLAGSRTGVYIGQSTSDYALLSSGLADPGTYTNPGLSPAVSANRLSYLWDLRGPSLTVDTACSSSLVAVHLAAGSLRSGECDLALAGGVNVLLSPVPQAGAMRLTALSPDGRCRPFDAGANGYVRGEGAGCVVLKRLPDAERDGDPVYAVIAGTAVNQDGRTNGLTAPSGAAQRAVVTEALRAAGVRAEDVDYVEAHGTGTPLGDPIEARALANALGPRVRPLLVGSVKANLGHLEAAAGIAGLIKAALMLWHATVPPSPCFEQPNPRIDLAGWRLAVPVDVLPWPSSDRPAVAGVSSFGFGGTNAHAVLRAAPAVAATAPPVATGPASAPRPVLLALSARSPASLAALTAAYATEVRSCGTWPEVADLADSAAWERSHFEYRRAFVAADPDELLDALGAGVPRHPAPRAGRLAFVYAGHGSQWCGMGRDLLDADPAFTAEVERCAAAFGPLLGWSVTAALRGRYPVDLDDVAMAQPLIVTVQAATTATLRARGIVPDAVVGHSVGEVSAAYSAGRLSLVDACRIVHARNRAVAPDAGTGAMAVVDLPADGIGELPAGVAVAAYNSPRATVLSGPVAGIGVAEARLRAAGREVRRVNVTYASHCGLMSGAAERLRGSVCDVFDRPADTAFYSTVSGGDATRAPLGAGHWAANLSRSVRFAEAVAAMLADGVTHLVEVGPHPLLLTALGECLAASGVPGTAVGTLHRNRPLRHGALDLVARLYEAGWTPRFPAHRRPRGARPLPTYPFDRRPVPTLGFALPEVARPLPEPELADRLAACASVAERRAVLSAEMLNLLDEVLPDSGRVADRIAVPFHDLGLDSLMAVELRNRLEKRLRTTLSVALLWRYPTVQRLAHALADRPVDSAAVNSAAGELLRLLDEVDAEVSG